MENIFSKKSSWIWTPEWTQIDQSEAAFVYFRKELILDTCPSRFLIQVSADSRYRLYVNGESVAFGPCKGDDQIWHFEEVDIASYLVKGKNVIAALVLKYPVSHGKGNQSIWRTDLAGLYFEGTMEFSEGESVLIKADATWKAYKTDHIRIVPESEGLNYLWIFERVKGEREVFGWKDIEYDDGAWKAAKVYPFLEVKQSVSPGNLVKRPIPMMYETEKRFVETYCVRESSIAMERWNEWLHERGQIVLSPLSHHVIEINAGELTTGFLHLEVVKGSGSLIKIISAEAYVYDDEQIGHLGRSIRKGNRIDSEKGALLGFQDIYEVGGFGLTSKAEVYEPFWFRTFRFIQLEITTGDEELRLERFFYRETGYPLQVQTWVETSDVSLKGIWDISMRSLKRCMHETYEDCPFFEQLQYAMDTRSQILYTYAVSADDRLARKAIDEFHRSLRADGTINCCYPSYEANIIPGFSLYYVLMIYDHMMYFGDADLVRRYMPTVEAIFGFFTRSIGSDGLVGKIGDPLFEGKYWSFVDWTGPWNETLGVPSAIRYGNITMESLLFAFLLEKGAELAAYIGKNELSQQYVLQSEGIKAAIRKICIGHHGMIQDGPGVDEYSQHCQVWAVLSGAVEGEEAKELMKRTLEDPELAQCSVAMAYYLFRALEIVGLYEETRPLWEPWHEMLRMNLTTCVEDPVTARSDCHAWGSLILYELPAVVLGVRPTKPGFKEIEIRPNPGHLKWAKGEVITPIGMVKVSWERENDHLKVKYMLPEDTEWRYKYLSL